MRAPGRFSRHCPGTVVMQAEIPLQGLSLVVTRPPAQAARTALLLRAAGAYIIEFPVLAIASINATLPAAELASAGERLIRLAVEEENAFVRHAAAILASTTRRSVACAVSRSVAGSDTCDGTHGKTVL